MAERGLQGGLTKRGNSYMRPVGVGRERMKLEESRWLWFLTEAGRGESQS